MSPLMGSPGGVSMQGKDNEVIPRKGPSHLGTSRWAVVVKLSLVLSSRRSEARSQGA